MGDSFHVNDGNQQYGSRNNPDDEQALHGSGTPSPDARPVLTRLLCLFSLTFFVVVVAFFFTRDTKVGIIRLQDILTMLNPLLLVPLFYTVALVDASHSIAGRPPCIQQLMFLLGVVVYVHGDGMHLAANAINRYSEFVGDQDAKDAIEFYDEELGHYYPYSGLLLLHVLWVVRQTKWRFEDRFETLGSRIALVFGGILHGFTLFIYFVEGRFAIPGFAFFAAVLSFLLVQYRRLDYDPIHLFSASFCGMGLVLMIVWLIWQGGLPELTEAGLV